MLPPPPPLSFAVALWQYPKDFALIASFLPYKSAQECVAFYYLAKPAAAFKQKLKAQSVALRRRAARNGWALAVQALEAVGCGDPCCARVTRFRRVRSRVSDAADCSRRWLAFPAHVFPICS